MAGPLKPDKWYEDRGLTPPEHLTHANSEEVKPDLHLHKWEAQGPWLHCDQGQNGHGIPYDHTKFVFNGTDSNGQPILKPIVLTNQKDSDAYLAEQVDTEAESGTIETRV